MTMNRLTSFGCFNTGEGDRISFTYSVIDADTGEIVEQNKKGTFLVLDDTVQEHLNSIRNYIKNKYLTQEG